MYFLLLYLCLSNCIVNLVDGNFVHTYVKKSARCGHTGVAMNNRFAVFAGGDNGQSSIVSTIDVYDNKLDEWTTLSMITGRSGLASASVGNIAYFVGGSTTIVGAASYTTNIEYLSLNSSFQLQVHAAPAQLSQGRTQIAATSTISSMIFAGGYASGTYYANVDIINTLGHLTTTSLANGRSRMAAISKNNYAFFAGGRTKSGYSNLIEAYNATSGSWFAFPNLSVARADLTATVLNQIGYFAGGVTQNGLSNVVDIYNLANMTFINSASLSVGRFNLASVSLMQTMLFAGGAFNTTMYSSAVDLWSPGDPVSYDTLTAARGGLVGVSVGIVAFFGGGKTLDGCSVFIDRFDYVNAGTSTTTAATNASTSGAPSDNTSITNVQSLLTHKDGSSSTLSNGAKGGIIAAAIIFFIIIVLLALLVLLLKRRRVKENKHIDLSSLPAIKGIAIKEKLGGGNFGEVFKGEWKGAAVALKKLKSDEYEEFEKECLVLFKLMHPNILQFMGVYADDSDNKYIVTEFMSKGNMLNILKADVDKVISLEEMMDIAIQAAAGMAYLEGEKIVHRDLALRNLLVSSSSEHKFLVKVSDFGLSRTIKDNSYYSNEDTSNLPLKWSAPESIQYGRFSSKSDVWSFGVSLWELFSRGMIPYFTMTNKEAATAVLEGYRMPTPDDCPQEVYELILSCWDAEPNKRPSFEQILNKLTSLCRQYYPHKKLTIVTAPQIDNSDNSMYNNV